MLFGHNSNIAVGTDTVHVQTEDRGANHAFIDTTVHWKGRVLHRRTNNYQDLLPLDAERESTVKARVDEQHRAVIEEIRSGALQLSFPVSPRAPVPAVAKLATGVPPERVMPAPQLKVLKIEVVNAKTWLFGKRATLQVMVRDSAGNPVSGAETKARIEGALSPAEFTAVSGDDGYATSEFEMPKLSGPEVALAIEATRNGAKGLLRFQLRVKPRI